MDTTLINRIELEKWIDSFSRAKELSADRHIDTFVNTEVTASEWLSLTNEIMEESVAYIKECGYDIRLMYLIYLNPVQRKRNIPDKLSTRLISQSFTPPVIILCHKSPVDLLFDGSILVSHLCNEFQQSVYYYEQHEDVIYRSLYFIPKM